MIDPKVFDAIQRGDLQRAMNTMLQHNKNEQKRNRRVIDALRKRISELGDEEARLERIIDDIREAGVV